MVEKFKKEGSFKKARKLQKFVDQAIVSKPELSNVCPELDSRFVKIDLNNETSFDGWLTLSSLGNKMKIEIPFKKSKHFNKLLNNGEVKGGVRISNRDITFNFELEEPKIKESDNVLGVDIGVNDLLSCSDGFQKI